MSNASADPAEFEPLQSAPEGDSDDLSHDFFASHSLAPVEMAWEPEPPPVMAAGSRRAMHATVGLLVASAVGIGGFLFYARVLMPTPVALGGAVAQPPSSYTMPADAVVVAPAVPVAAAQEVLAVEVVAVEELGAAEPAPVEVEAEIEVTETVAAEVAPVVTATARDARPRTRRAIRRRTPTGGLAKRAFKSLNRGDFAGAARLAERAVLQQPENSQSWIVLAAARDALGNKAGAQRAYRMCSHKAQDPAVSHCRSLAR